MADNFGCQTISVPKNSSRAGEGFSTMHLFAGSMGRKKPRKEKSCLMTDIESSLSLVSSSLLLFTAPLVSPSYQAVAHPHVLPKALPIAQVVMTGSIYSTLAITVERYKRTRPIVTTNLIGSNCWAPVHPRHRFINGLGCGRCTQNINELMAAWELVVFFRVPFVVRKSIFS